MTKIKWDKIERFYLSERGNLLFEINSQMHDFNLSEEILHSVMFKCINEYSKSGRMHQLTYDYIMDMCKETVLKIKIQREITSVGYVVAADPYDVILCKENLEFLTNIIDNLRTYNIVLRLYLLEDYSVSEMAALLDMKPNTVSKQVHRGMIKLREEVKKSKYFQSWFV